MLTAKFVRCAGLFVALPTISLSISLVGAKNLCAADAKKEVSAKQHAPGFATPVTRELVDGGSFAQWSDGKESPAYRNDKKVPAEIEEFLATTTTGVSHAGKEFGATKTPGVRHMRVGFKEAIPVGAVMVRGGVQVSVLKDDPSIKYPGDLADDAQWIPAQRIVQGQLSRAEGIRDNYILWSLPKQTATRAIRFTHNADVADRNYAGYLGGAYVLSEPVANVATQATPVVSANDRNKTKLINEHTDPVWEQWANIPLQAGDRPQVISPESPEWVMLTWHAPVKLRGLGTMFAGFKEAEVQAFSGAEGMHPREAKEGDWKTVGKFTDLKNRYPSVLPADWLAFDEPVTTRAIRIRMIQPMAESGHQHAQGHTRKNKRVWVGELVALGAVDNADLKTALLPTAGIQEQPPIAIKFNLPEDGIVTLVIEDAAGKRIRNLVAETPFKKGENTVYWDGSDDLGRDPSAYGHGLYYIPHRLVEPGKYTVRGMWRKDVNVKYELSVYNAGNPAWNTSDNSGGWLANHTPPSSVLFVPDAGKGEPSMLIGSYVSEGGSGLAWVDLNGKKTKGQNWVGGNWTGAPYLARDLGTDALPEIYAYVGAAWSGGADPTTKKEFGEIRLTGLTAKGDKPIAKIKFNPPTDGKGDDHWVSQIAGIAAHNGQIVVSMAKLNQLMLVDAKTGKQTGELSLDAPQGLAFDAQGNLFAISGKRVVKLSADKSGKFSTPVEVIAESNLEEPRGITVDSAGNIFVSDRGTSHQVKVFTPRGDLITKIGAAGVPKAGKYDPHHMNNPRGVAIDSENRLWVAEEDSRPKRISVWSADGKLLKQMFGPADYGGGGSVDPSDKSKFYYYGMEFKLDWEKGTDELVNIIFRPGEGDLKLSSRAGVPQSALYINGHRYFTNAFNSNPTNGHALGILFIDRNGIAVPCAAVGRATDWDALKTPEILPIWPKDTDPKAEHYSQKTAFFVWSDANADGQIQAAEVQMKRGGCGGVTVSGDGSFLVARYGEKALRFAPTHITKELIPIYDLQKPQVLLEGAQPSPSTGGDQVLIAPSGWTIHTTAPKPFSAYGIGGSKNGQPMWTYPSPWPGLHAAHEAPPPDRPGQVIGHTRLLGDMIMPKEAEPMFMLNGNHGNIYVFTADGLFVAQIFRDVRQARPWGMPVAQRGMLLNDLTPSDENFWTSVTQTPDRSVYVMAGRPNCIVKVEGLETITRIAPFEITVGAAELEKASEYFVRSEAARQASQGRGVLEVSLRKSAPVVDGKLDDWASGDWADIDKRGVRAYFNSDSKPYNVTGAVAIADGKLFAAWHTEDKNLLRNTGEVPTAPFKTGGALDLMIGTASKADPKRKTPVAGDLRLLVTQVKGKTLAVLYRAVDASRTTAAKEPVPFSSPWRTIKFDRVDDVSQHVQLAGIDGDYEISIPLSVLGIKPAAGETIQGDIGILRGNGMTTTQRVYWSNKATAIVSDVPSEAELQPSLWGRWEFVTEK